ncbi:MAG: DsbA family protein [Myxococcota bacterium]
MRRAAVAVRVPCLVALLAAPACEAPERPEGVLESSTAVGADDPTRVAPDATTTPARGAANPLAVVTVFTDFRCRHCPRAIRHAERLSEAFGDDLQVQFRHYPLAAEGTGTLAARAAAAAHRQEAFARMRDRLFATADAWGDLPQADLEAHLADLAEGLHLDRRRFLQDLRDPAVAGKVRRDSARASLLGAPGTPTFYVGSRRVGPRGGVVALIRRTREALREGRSLLREGAPRDQVAYRAAAADREGHPRAADWLVADRPPVGSGGPGSSTSSSAGVERWDVTVRPDDPRRGGARARVTLVVFEDLESPFARGLDDALKQVEQRFGDRVRVIFKALPLPHHPRARPAALALECARRQGRFLDLRAALLRDDADLGDEALVAEAGDLGLDVARFERCLGSDAAARRIVEDRLLAERVAARGAPITYVQGVKVPGAPSADDLATVVETELERAEDLAPAGADAGAIYEAALEGARTRSPLRPLGRQPELTGSERRGPADADVRGVIFADVARSTDRVVAERLADLADAPRRTSLALHLRPLAPEGDARAEAVARALLCAGRLGRLWSFHDALVDQGDPTEARLGPAARRAALDDGRFARCLEDPEVGDAVRATRREARALGIHRSPALVLGDRLYDGTLGWDRHALRRLIGIAAAE